MPAGSFRFKQFTVAHDQCTHKVGTDGVLIGAWVRLSPADRRVLDVGTGSGLISLMVAQRSGAPTQIDAIDIGDADVCQARDNVARSPWRERIAVYHTSLQDFAPAIRYDLIVTNPPYFINSLPAPDGGRSRARHTILLPYDDLLAHSVRLLKPSGRLALILPFREGLEFLRMASSCGLSVLRKTMVRSRGDKPPERLLMELAFTGGPENSDELILYDRDNSWSAAYKNLARPFYLKT